VPDPFLAFGLPGLFVVALLAGSVVPLPSEALLAGLIWQGQAPATAVVVATLGNTLGAATLFWLGGRLARGSAGGRFFRWLERRTGVDGPQIERARARLGRWGSPAMLFTWLPFVGDVIVVAAGFAGSSWTAFVIFAGLGKALRFAVVAATAAAAVT
jgi:membrane protein YqaA with SNARE-associated domain